MSNFTYDCSKCAAFCCIALGFEKGDKFAHDKPKNERCHNLDACNRCNIHEDLEPQGYHGCIEFSCHGAGMHIMSLYKKVDWQGNSELTQEVYGKFHFLKSIFRIADAVEQTFKKKGINTKPLIKSFFKMVSTRQKVPLVTDEENCQKMTDKWGKMMEDYLKKNSV